MAKNNGEVPMNYEAGKRLDRVGMATEMHQELTTALETLTRAQSEIEQDQFHAARLDIAKVKNAALGVKVAAERLEALLRLKEDEH